MTNKFLEKMSTHNTTTWNGAVSNTSSGSSLLDYFSKMGSYRGRTEAEVSADMASIFGEDALTALKLVFFNRLITRRVKGFSNETEAVQRGSGNRDEFQKSINWIERNYPDLLYNNLWLVPIAGRWSDLFYYSAATQYKNFVKPEKVYELIQAGLQSDYHRGLIAKALPKLRSRSNVKNERHLALNNWARGLCNFLDINEKQYRLLKSDPQNTAHQFQRVMCSNQWDKLDFNTISGKALFNLLSQKGKDKKNSIERHGLEEKYLEWIQSQPVAKFTGYPYELYNAARTSSRTLIQKYTFDSQFNGLLEKAKDSVDPELLKKGVLCALDTSGSMESDYWGNGFEGKIAPIDICVGLGLYFSALLDGYFHNHVIMFDDTSRFLKLRGESFCDKVDQISKHATAWGSTNFDSIIEEIVRVRRQNPSIPVEDFPQVLLIVSDMQFSPVGSVETNYESAVRKLSSVGLPPMTFIFWQVNGRFTGDVPSTIADPGTVLVSGMDGAIITAILDGMEKVIDKETGELRSKTPYETMMDCLDQEILQKIIV